MREIDGEQLIVPTLRSRFSLQCRSPLLQTMWLLGFYQAEGTKSERDLSFELSNKSRVLLGQTLDCLAAIGVAKDRGRLTVIWERSPEREVANYYRVLGMEMQGHPVKTVKQRDHVAILTLRESAGFVRLLRAALRSITPTSFNAEARRAFLFGFLAGDGSVTFSTTDILRASCGSPQEATLIATLLAEYLGGAPIVIKQIGGTFVVGRTITIFHAVDLIEHGAFVGTSSRVKLFHIAQRLHKLSRSGAMRRWGYIEPDGSPTQRVLEARARLAAHDAEWQHVKALYPTEREATMRRKGVLYEYPPMQDI